MAEIVPIEVVGAAEAADILEVELGRITRWRANGKLPPPYSSPKCSPVWIMDDIRRFHENGNDAAGLTFTKPPAQMPLLGTEEVAALLKVDKSQIGRWRRTPPRSGPWLPPPFCEIKAGRLWVRQAILQFARARRRALAA